MKKQTISGVAIALLVLVLLATSCRPTPLAPAEFEISNLIITPSQVEVGEQATITVDIQNIGEVEGVYTVALEIDRAVVETKEVTVAGGEAVTVTFTVVKDAEGTYDVQIGPLTQSLVVTTPTLRTAELPKKSEIQFLHVYPQIKNRPNEYIRITQEGENITVEKFFFIGKELSGFCQGDMSLSDFTTFWFQLVGQEPLEMKDRYSSEECFQWTTIGGEIRYYGGADESSVYRGPPRLPYPGPALLRIKVKYEDRPWIEKTLDVEYYTYMYDPVEFVGLFDLVARQRESATSVVVKTTQEIEEELENLMEVSGDTYYEGRVTFVYQNYYGP